MRGASSNFHPCSMLVPLGDHPDDGIGVGVGTTTIVPTMP
jgi:hypothetical protein